MNQDKIMTLENAINFPLIPDAIPDDSGNNSPTPIAGKGRGIMPKRGQT